jgi:glycerol-3-phosphate dehydrogenase (NAD(P)+)
MNERVAILGAGAWGTAMAVHLAQLRPPPAVALWARDREQVQAIHNAHENARYLPGVALPQSICVSAELKSTVAGASLVLVATPIAALLDMVAALRGLTDAPLIWLGKGFVDDPAAASGVALPHMVVASRWPSPVGVVSGPSFAEEVALGLPTAVSIAATEATLAESVAEQLRGSRFRAYTTSDLTGVETGGAVKNVLAIAAGISDGLGFGHNARAALITRGLAETGRLSAALGGRRETLMGLAGLGDLVLTCTGDLSRNRRVGLGLARSRPLAEIVGGIGHVAEGVAAARAVHALAAAFGVDMPICEAAYCVLYEGLAPRSAVESLLAREPGREFD